MSDTLYDLPTLAASVPDHHPRYVVRELRGGTILPGGGRGPWNVTFTLMDSWYGYAVILQRESGSKRAPWQLRAMFARIAAYMNGPARICAYDECENEVPRRPLDSGQRRRGGYCSDRCRYAAKNQREREERRGRVS